MGMKQFPEVQQLANGARLWQHRFDSFRVKVYVPQGHPLADIVNFGFRFITEGDEAIASSNGGKFLTYKMMTK